MSLVIRIFILLELLQIKVNCIHRSLPSLPPSLPPPPPPQVLQQKMLYYHSLFVIRILQAHHRQLSPSHSITLQVGHTAGQTHSPDTSHSRLNSLQLGHTASKILCPARAKLSHRLGQTAWRVSLACCFT